MLEDANAEFEKKKLIEEIKKEVEQKKTFLDLGLIDGLWYYGRKHNGMDSIITSNRRMLVNRRTHPKQPLELDEIRQLFDYDNTLNDFAPLMSKEAVIKWLEENNNEITPKTVYESIKKKILWYMDFAGEDEIADVMTCWIMATYHYPLFYWFPNILLNAPRESGKTKCSDIIIRLAFKGYDIGASAGATPAQFFRTIDMCRGTIRADEYEKLDNDSKKLVDQLLNAGVSRDSYIIRTEKIKGRHIPTKFIIFCPKIACNISGINSTTLTRFIAFRWLKTLSEKANRQPTNILDNNSFKPIRDDLYIYGLKYWKSVEDSYGKVAIPKLKGRAADNWKPLYAVANLVGDDATKALQKYIDNYKELDIDTNDPTEEFLNILLDIVSVEEKFYACKSIAEWQAIIDLLSFTKSASHWIGKKLTEYKFKKQRTAGNNGYKLSKSLVREKLELYFGYDSNEVPK